MTDRSVTFNPTVYKTAQWIHSAWQLPFVFDPHVAGAVYKRGSWFSERHIGSPAYYPRDLTRPRWVCRIHHSLSHVATTPVMNSHNLVSPALALKWGYFYRQARSKSLFPKGSHVVLFSVLWTGSQDKLSVRDYGLAQLERNHAQKKGQSHGS